MNATNQLTTRTRRAIKKYGQEICERAYSLNAKNGEGPYTVAIYCGLSGVRAANAAIDAGRELDRTMVEDWNATYSAFCD